MCLEDFFPLHVLLPRVWSRPPSRSQPFLPARCKVNPRRAVVEVRKKRFNSHSNLSTNRPPEVGVQAEAPLPQPPRPSRSREDGFYGLSAPVLMV
jgi:hypothetical protein